MRLKGIVNGYMVEVPEVKEYCERCLKTQRWSSSVVLVRVDAAFASIGLNYFHAVESNVRRETDEDFINLTCMLPGKYKENSMESKSWKYVLRRIKQWLHLIDVYAIDCIRLKSSGKMLGLWSPSRDGQILKEILAEKLDS